MKLFIIVVDSGSFSAAARELGVAPTSVARQISALEDLLAVRLLNRTTRRHGLTEAGAVYYARAKQILADIEAANAEVGTLMATPRGTLRVTAPVALGRAAVLPGIPGFLARHPELRLELSLTDSVVDLIEQGVDVAVRMGVMASSSLIARRLADSLRVVCGSPDYLARFGTPRSPAELGDHNCITFDGGDAVVWQFVGPMGSSEVAVGGTFVSNSAEALRDAALGGVGLVRLPLWLVHRDLARGTLQIVLEDHRDAAGPTPIHAVYAHNRLVSAKIQAFVDHLTAAFAAWSDAS